MLCLGLALLGCASGASVDDTFVPSDLPVYVNGVRLAPQDGGHHTSLDRENGLRVDGVLFMAVAIYPPFVAPVRGDGIPYAVHGALLAAAEAIRAGGNRDHAKQAMVAFRRAEYGDSLVVKKDGDAGYEITYRGESVSVPVADTDDYHPEQRDAPMEILGGKYVLSGSEVRDFVTAQTSR